MKNVTWIKVVRAEMGETVVGLMDKLGGLKGKVVVIGQYIQVSGVNRYDTKQTDLLTDLGFTMVEDYEFESRI